MIKKYEWNSFILFKRWKLLSIRSNTHWWIVSGNGAVLSNETLPLEVLIQAFNDKEYYESEIGHMWKYIGSILTCNKCKGAGVLDFVENVMGKRGHRESPIYDFFKISEGRERKVEMDPSITANLHTYHMWRSPHIFVRTAVKPRIMEYCSECKGTGLYVARMMRVVDKPYPVEKRIKEIIG